jgi:hypothetical protein
MARTRFGALLTAQTRDERRRRAMHGMNEMDLWNQRRHELVREAEGGRLARRLRVARPKRVARFRSALFGRGLEAPVLPRAARDGRA